MPPRRPPPPPPAGGRPPAGGAPPPEPPPIWPPVTFSSIVISLSVCVITQDTLSAPCMRSESPWLLLLSSVQVPAKLAGAAACTASANMSALARLRAQSIFLIQHLLHEFVIVSKTSCADRRSLYFEIRTCGEFHVIANKREREVYQSVRTNTVMNCKELYMDGKAQFTAR